jgi:hypothetical protein
MRHNIYRISWVFCFMILTNCTKPSRLGSREKLNASILSWYLLSELESHTGTINDDKLDILIRSIEESENRLFAKKLRKDGKIWVTIFRGSEVIILDPGVKNSKGNGYCYIIQPGADSIQYASREDLK